MAKQAYVIEDTFIVCSYALSVAPRKINRNPEAAQHRIRTIHTREIKPYMTIDDKKLNDCFNCKSPAKRFGGFAALVAGIAVGAACVLTGGTALVIIIAAAAVVTVAAPAIAVIVHDCDETLAGTWLEHHRSVKIEGHYALINPSFLKCPKGGMLHLMLDEAKATQAMRQLFWQNLGETSLNTASNFVIGFINGRIGAQGGYISLGITSTLAIGLESAHLFLLGTNTQSSGEDATKEAINYAVSEGLMTAANTMISKGLYNNAVVDASLDVLVALERVKPPLASKILDDMVAHMNKNPATFKDALKHYDVKSSLVPGLWTAGISLGSSFGQREIDKYTTKKLINLNDLEEESASFNVVADKG